MLGPLSIGLSIVKEINYEFDIWIKNSEGLS